jgi:hypothetical protein
MAITITPEQIERLTGGKDETATWAITYTARNINITERTIQTTPAGVDMGAVHAARTYHWQTMTRLVGPETAEKLASSQF